MTTYSDHRHTKGDQKVRQLLINVLHLLYFKPMYWNLYMWFIYEFAKLKGNIHGLKIYYLLMDTTTTTKPMSPHVVRRA